MLERRSFTNLAYLLMGFMLCFAIFQVILNTTPDVVRQEPEAYFYSVYTNISNTYMQPYESLPSQDYSQLIDLNFTFTIMNLVCNETSPLVLVVVHSSPKNFAKRQTIRETWGQKNDYVKIVFMIGNFQSAKLKQAIAVENSKFRDLIQGNFSDSYRNLTYKHVMVLKYAIYHCPGSKYILKTDDDVFVNTPLLVNFLVEEISPYGAGNLLLCQVAARSEVKRSFRSKWRVSFKEYPNKLYPTYCLGWTVLYSPDVIFALYKESQKADYFWIDDIHITGSLAAKVGVAHKKMDPFIIEELDLNDIIKNYKDDSVPLDYQTVVPKPFLFGLADLRGYQIRALWNFVQVHFTPKSIMYY